MCRYKSIVAYTRAQEYLGGRMLPSEHQKAFLEVKDKLVSELWRLYRDALLAESQGRKDKARQFYNMILQRTGPENDFFKHVQERQSRL